jgi:hypothetical protein
MTDPEDADSLEEQLVKLPQSVVYQAAGVLMIRMGVTIEDAAGYLRHIADETASHRRRTTRRIFTPQPRAYAVSAATATHVARLGGVVSVGERARGVKRRCF